MNKSLFVVSSFTQSLSLSIESFTLQSPCMEFLLATYLVPKPPQMITVLLFAKNQAQIHPVEHEAPNIYIYIIIYMSLADPS